MPTNVLSNWKVPTVWNVCRFFPAALREDIGRMRGDHPARCARAMLEVVTARIDARLLHLDECGIRMDHDGGEHDAAEDDRPHRIPIEPEHRGVPPRF